MAGNSLYLIGENELITEMPPGPYESEPEFERLLVKFPELLAGDQINPDEPRRWVLVADKLGVPVE